MTAYQKIKTAAQRKGIDTRKGAGGYWLTKKDGSDLYPDDNFCVTLADLKSEVATYQ